MNPNTLAQDQASTLLNVDAKPMSLRLPIGSAIFTYSGEVWITQEGMHEDVILAPGERFDVHSRAQIVASATKGRAATVYIACPPEATERADVDVYALLRQRAERLRAEELNEIARAISGQLSRGLAAVFAQLRAMLAPFKRVPITNASR